MSTGVIAFDSVGFGYRGRRVFEDFSWSVSSGLTALMGPNGAGKTTLLGLAAGQLHPSAGAVRVSPTSGRDTRVALLPQRFSFVPSMRVEEAVAHASWCSGVSAKDVPAQVASALTRVGLAERGRERVKSLSGGMRQRLGVACALSGAPSVLLLDEPSVGLDPIQRRSLRELLVALATETTIVLSTHLVDDVVATADRVAVLNEGRLCFDGTLGELVGSARDASNIQDLEAAYADAVGESR